MVPAPQIPLHQLGWLADGATDLKMASPIAAVATTAAVSSVGAGTAFGAAAGPIGAAVGAVIGIIAGLWAAHAARAKGAKTENAAVNSAVQAFDASLKALFDAANSGGVTPSQAVQILQQISQQYWQGMTPFMTGPGRADASGAGRNCAALAAAQAKSNQCNKSCTAGCCVGCMNVYPVITAASQMFSGIPAGPPYGQLNSDGSFTLNVTPVNSSKYGASARAGYSLSYKPPSTAQSIDGELSSLTGGGSILPLLLLAGAFLVLQ
jgi:hypothetical protein